MDSISRLVLRIEALESYLDSAGVDVALRRDAWDFALTREISWLRSAVRGYPELARRARAAISRLDSRRGASQETARHERTFADYRAGVGFTEIQHPATVVGCADSAICRGATGHATRGPAHKPVSRDVQTAILLERARNTGAESHSRKRRRGKRAGRKKQQSDNNQAFRSAMATATANLSALTAYRKSLSL